MFELHDPTDSLVHEDLLRISAIDDIRLSVLETWAIQSDVLTSGSLVMNDWTYPQSFIHQGFQS